MARHGDTDRGYDREELNADNRRKVMDAWKRFESSKPGVWLSRHTDLLERLSDEESHLVARVGAMVCVFALILSMVLFLAVQGDVLAWTLLTLPVSRSRSWLSWPCGSSGTRIGIPANARRTGCPRVPAWPRGVSSPRTMGRVPSTVTWFRPSCRACWPTSATGNHTPSTPAPGMPHGMWASRGTWRCGWVPNGTSTCWVLPVPARPSASSSPPWSRPPVSCSRPPREGTSSKRRVTCVNAA